MVQSIAVRSVQPTENANDQPNRSRRAARPGVSGGFRHGRFGTRLPAVADDVRTHMQLRNVEEADVGIWLPHSSLDY